MYYFVSHCFTSAGSDDLFTGFTAFYGTLGSSRCPHMRNKPKNASEMVILYINEFLVNTSAICCLDPQVLH